MFNVANQNVLSSTGIAILASLGIHGLLWAILPGMTVSQADKSPSERNINLVELSPQEQSRLPQSNPADNTLPAFASQLTALPPLPPAPPYQTSVIPPVQLSPGSAAINNVSPNQNSAPPLQTFQVPSPPPPPSFPAIPYEIIPNSNPLQPIPQAAPFVLPPNINLPEGGLTPDRTLPPDDEIAKATPSPAPTQPSPANLIAPAANPPEAAKVPERGKQELLAMRDSMRNNFPQQVVTPASPNTRALSRSELVTALKRQRPASTLASPNTRALSRSELVTALKRQSRNPSNQLSEETKTALDNLEKFKRQQATVQAQNPGVVTGSPIRRKLTTCDRPLDDLAVVSVVVNPQGKRLSEPVLITSPRKANLTLAQNYVRNYGFTKTGKTTNYNFRLEFDYIASKCAQAKPTPTPTPNSTPAPNPTPTLSSPKPTPNSTPAPNPSPEPTSTPLPLDSNKPSF